MLDALSDDFGFKAFLSSMKCLYVLLLFIMQCGWLANYKMRQMKLEMRQRGIETALSSISVSGILLPVHFQDVTYVDHVEIISFFA